MLLMDPPVVYLDGAVAVAVTLRTSLVGMVCRHSPVIPTSCFKQNAVVYRIKVVEAQLLCVCPESVKYHFVLSEGRFQCCSTVSKLIVNR